mgnify:CR=1 FL=1
MIGEDATGFVMTSKGRTVVTMGLLSLPAMMRAGYSPSLATGTICASGTLGQIIPPSMVLIILGDQMQAAYDKATRDPAFACERASQWSPCENLHSVSVSELFAGAFLRRRGVAVEAVLLAPDRAHAAGLRALRRAGGRGIGARVAQPGDGQRTDE